MIEVCIVADPLDGNDELEMVTVLGGVPSTGQCIVLEDEGNQCGATVTDVVFYPDQIPRVYVRLETYSSEELYSTFKAMDRHKSIHGTMVELEAITRFLTHPDRDDPITTQSHISKILEAEFS